MARTTCGELGILSGNTLKLAVKTTSLTYYIEPTTNEITLSIDCKQEAALLKVLLNRQSAARAVPF